MKKFALVTLVFCVFAMADIAVGQIPFKATIDGAQAGTGSAATGDAVLILNAESDSLSMEINFAGLTTAEITGFHIHQGGIGESGGVVFGIVNPAHDNDGDFVDNGTGFVSEWDSNDGGFSLVGLLGDLSFEALYFNVHTSSFPGGEIRGQIVNVSIGDVNLDNVVSLLDVLPFVDVITGGSYQIEADVNLDGSVDLLDVQDFVDILTDG